MPWSLASKMNYPALKGEVSINKMTSQINPRLGRSDVMLHSFTSCVSNASKKLSRAPEMSLPEMVSQPGMLLQKFKGGISFKQLECFANTHSGWHFNKQMHMVSSDMQLIDLKSMSFSSLLYENPAIHSDAIELHGISSVLGLPHKVEGILPEGMFSAPQIHFFAPANSTRNGAHAKFAKFSSRGATSAPLVHNQSEKLNIEDGNSSLCFKAEVSLPLM